MEDNSNKVTGNVPAKDTTPKVIGIGGIFFYTDSPDKTKEWYIKNLGLEINDWWCLLKSA